VEKVSGPLFRKRFLTPFLTPFPEVPGFFTNVMLGAAEGGINGGGLAFLQGAMTTAMRSQTWSQGYQLGLIRVGEAGISSALIGLPTGAVIGGMVRAFQRLAPSVGGSERTRAGALLEMEDAGLYYQRLLPGAPGTSDAVMLKVHERLQQMQTIAYGPRRAILDRVAMGTNTPADDQLLRFLQNQACGNLAASLDDAACTGLAEPVTPQNYRSAGTPHEMTAVIPGAERVPITASVSDAQAQIIQRLLDAGNGTRALLYLERAGGTAHFVNIENIQGQIWLFDTIQGIAVPLSGPHQNASITDALLRVIQPAPVVPNSRLSRMYQIRPNNGMELVITARPQS
jgi:hypothetical protein